MTSERTFWTSAWKGSSTAPFGAPSVAGEGFSEGVSDGSGVSLMAATRITSVGPLSRGVRPRRPSPVVEPRAIFLHLRALFLGRAAAAGGRLTAARGGAPAGFHAVVGVVGGLERRRPCHHV